MSYLSNFEEDVFISYAHYDDDAYPSEPKGWVAQLHDDLEKRVKVHLGAALSLWRDCEIRNNEDFEKKILKRLIKTATLLSIISPSFVRREWCKRELEEFVASAEKSFGIRIDDDQKFRIFKVEKIPVDPRILPPSLQKSGSYKFHWKDPRDGEIHELRPNLGTEYGRRYFDEMDELARDIAQVLQGLAEKPAKDRPIRLPRAVYVAETSTDLVEQATEIKRDLKSRGYTVFPSSDLPIDSVEFCAEVRKYLEQSIASVHLVGNEYGSIPEGEKVKSRPWLQCDLAIERGSVGDFSRFVWLPGDVQPVDDQQSNFVKYILENPEVASGADVLKGKLEDLKTQLKEKLVKIEEPGLIDSRDRSPHLAAGSAGISDTKPTQEPLRIYIACNQSEREADHLNQLKTHLFHLGYEPILPLEQDDSPEARREHAENLSICDACIIYYGDGSEKWFNSKLMDLRKVLSPRSRPILSKAIYLAPPQTPIKSRLQTHEAIVIHATDAFSPEPLTEFLEQLRQTFKVRRAYAS